MDSKFLLILPSSVHRLVEEIEDFAGMEIAVKANPYPILSDSSNPLCLMCKTDHECGEIYYRDEKRINPQHLLHEILHIYRYWVKMVPKMMPRNRIASNYGLFERIDNALEHLIIVPKEIEYGFEMNYSYWNENYSFYWSQYPWRGSDYWTRKFNCYMGWLSTTYLTNDQKLKLIAEGYLKHESLLDKATKFGKKVNKEMTESKQHAVLTVSKYVNIPSKEIDLVVFDIRNKKQIISRLD